MATNNYRVLSCEGGDQVGKGDAISNLSEGLLRSGIPITYSSFPIYATPLGTTIRMFLKNGLDEFKFDKIKELKVKMALYALNRLEFMEILLSNPLYKKTLILLDRSSFSNAVTIGYGLATVEKLKNSKTVEELINYALNLDSFMIKKLGLGNCVVQMVLEDSNWENVRKEKSDINENDDVQVFSEKIYDTYQKKIGKGWKKVVTKNSNGWRPREEIYDEIYKFLVSRVGSLEKEKESKIYEMRYEIGIEEILSNIYKGEVLQSGILTKYLSALRSNDKDSMHKYGCVIGVEVGNTCQLVQFKNKGVRKAIKAIINELSEVLDVLSSFISKDFSSKFCKAVDE